MVQAKVFGVYHRAQNGLTLTSDQVKKSEMDVFKNLKRKNGSLLKKRGNFVRDISDSASLNNYHIKTM